MGVLIAFFVGFGSRPSTPRRSSSSPPGRVDPKGPPGGRGVVFRQEGQKAARKAYEEEASEYNRVAAPVAQACPEPQNPACLHHHERKGGVNHHYRVRVLARVERASLQSRSEPLALWSL